MSDHPRFSRKRAARKATVNQRVLAYHVIFSAYGFWLPNDPRGSWSEFVASWELFRYGSATKVETRQSVAGTAHDRQKRLEAKQALKYPPVEFTGPQALGVVQAFGAEAADCGYNIHACAILPDHVHLVLGRHAYAVEKMVGRLKAAASKALADSGQHPLAEWPGEDGSFPSPWARGCWKVFLFTAEDVRRSIRYAEENPAKEGKRQQTWSFVKPFAEEPDS
jgi:REP element-mobilizing transposase RayT